MTPAESNIILRSHWSGDRWWAAGGRGHTGPPDCLRASHSGHRLQPHECFSWLKPWPSQVGLKGKDPRTDVKDAGCRASKEEQGGPCAEDSCARTCLQRPEVCIKGYTLQVLKEGSQARKREMKREKLHSRKAAEAEGREWVCSVFHCFALTWPL